MTYLTLHVSDSAYPALLKQIPNPPKTLYVRGTLEPNEICFTIVGTRKPTSYGIETAKLFATQLSQAGFTIVSGLAFGIDAIAHQATLAAGGRTIAVLGSGVDIITPVTNQHIGEQIIERGALVSEFLPGTAAQKNHFPQRDRIMSGLSIGTLVIEASGQSGALITARNATEQGREVFAIPGQIFSHASQGAHKLIQEGAKLTQTIDDILCEFEQLHLFTNKIAHGSSRKTNENEQKILACLTEPKTLDIIAQETHIAIQELKTAITMLELTRKIAKQPDGCVRRIV